MPAASCSLQLPHTPPYRRSTPCLLVNRSGCVCLALHTRLRYPLQGSCPRPHSSLLPHSTPLHHRCPIPSPPPLGMLRWWHPHTPPSPRPCRSGHGFDSILAIGTFLQSPFLGLFLSLAHVLVQIVPEVSSPAPCSDSNRSSVLSSLVVAPSETVLLEPASVLQGLLDCT